MAELNGKALKFRALAEKRASIVIKTVRRIGNLSRRQTYDWQPHQVEKMFNAMRAELDAAQAKFTPREDGQQAIFRLD
jgi:hypothetical protein